MLYPDPQGQRQAEQVSGHKAWGPGSPAHALGPASRAPWKGKAHDVAWP